MELVAVLVTSSIGNHCLQQITATNPKVKLRDASGLPRFYQLDRLVTSTSSQLLKAFLNTSKDLISLTFHLPQ